MTDAQASGAAASCKAITTAQGQVFFLLVTWSDSSFDVRMTNMQQCWRRLGVRAPDHHGAFTPKVWLEHAKEALYDPQPPRQFQFEVEDEGDCMRLEWTAEYEQGRSFVCECTLQATTNTAAMLVSMMSHLCTSYRVLKGAIAEMDTQNGALKNLVDSTQSQLQAQIDAGRDREADLFVKFTAVLNSKKDTIRQLTEQLAGAQAAVESLTQRLAEEQVQRADAGASTEAEEDGPEDEEALEVLGYQAQPTDALDQRQSAQATAPSVQVGQAEQPVLPLAGNAATQGAAAMQVDEVAEVPQAAHPTQEDLLSELGF